MIKLDELDQDSAIDGVFPLAESEIKSLVDAFQAAVDLAASSLIAARLLLNVVKGKPIQAEGRLHSLLDIP